MEKKKILVVDDDPAILRLLSTNLKARGYEVVTAANGEESLEAVQRDFIDLIILDIMMPKVDGVEVCRRTREWSSVPIIILSARGDENDKVKCLELGADDYLTKPFGIAELMARVKTAFRHRGDVTANPTQANFNCDGLEINFAKRRVTVNDQEVRGKAAPQAGARPQEPPLHPDHPRRGLSPGHGGPSHRLEPGRRTGHYPLLCVPAIPGGSCQSRHQ